MRLSDENTREGRHLTPEERIALQAEEIKQLQKENNGWQERYYELDAGHSRLFKDFCKMRDALIIANNYMPDIGHFCTCGKCKRCGTDINYAGYKYCLKCARNIIDAALSDTPADYHNPADVELLRKARKALHKGISELKVHCKYFDNTPEEDACIMMHEAVIEIDKAIGGGDVNKG
mgnify:CR=1 FL=1